MHEHDYRELIDNCNCFIPLSSTQHEKVRLENHHLSVELLNLSRSHRFDDESSLKFMLKLLAY